MACPSCGGPAQRGHSPAPPGNDSRALRQHSDDRPRRRADALPGRAEPAAPGRRLRGGGRAPALSRTRHSVSQPVASSGRRRRGSRRRAWGRAEPPARGRARARKNRPDRHECPARRRRRGDVALPGRANRSDVRALRGSRRGELSDVRGRALLERSVAPLAD